MRQFVYHLEKEKQFSACSKVLSEPKKHEALIEFLFCGICGGDYSHYLGLRGKFPASLGHEFIARVLKTGEQVTEVQVGDLVVSDLNYRCNSCVFCKRQQTHLCIDNNIESFSNRGFATQALIDSSYLVVANDLKNILHGTLIEPLSCVIHAVSQINLNKNDDILIYGVGNIGTITAFYLTCILDLNNVYVYDHVAEKQKRVESLFRCRHYEDTHRYDVIIEATNSLSGIISALAHAKYAREICSISHLYGIDSSEIYEFLVKHEIKIKFPLRNGNKSTLQKAARLISEVWNTSYDCIFEVETIECINELFSKKHSSGFNKQVLSIGC